MPAIVGDTGTIVPPRQPEQLAQALIQALSPHIDIAVRRHAARQRIVDVYSLQRAAAGYESVWSGSLSGGSLSMQND
jgi:glycosyltransferase involved in cell wall biosynthesis